MAGKPKATEKSREIERADSLEALADIMEVEVHDVDFSDVFVRRPVTEMIQATARIVDLMAEAAPEAAVERERRLARIDDDLRLFSEAAGAVETARAACRIEGATALRGDRGRRLAASVRALRDVLSPSETTRSAGGAGLGERLEELVGNLEDAERDAPPLDLKVADALQEAISGAGRNHRDLVEARSRAPLVAEAVEREPRLGVAFSVLLERSLPRGNRSYHRLRLMEDIGLCEEALLASVAERPRVGFRP